MLTLAELKKPRCREARERTPSASARLAMDRLRGSPYLALRVLECRELDDEIHIAGSVASYFLKQMAQETLMSVRGIGRIVNDVVVSEAAPARSKRSALKAVFQN